MLQFAAPRIELRFIQAEFTGCGSNTDAFSKFQGFTAKFRRMLFTCFFWLILFLSCESPLTESLLT
ncbi:tRNA (adenine(37)-N6)-methyltransferase (plasmid) [Escherichia coli]|nr:tRNA (adenine(37)-N6)-methyltransferase [Escherichia coli]